MNGVSLLIAIAIKLISARPPGANASSNASSLMLRIGENSFANPAANNSMIAVAATAAMPTRNMLSKRIPLNCAPIAEPMTT